MTKLKNFFKDESGATAIEYGLLAALISIVGIVAFTAAGTQVRGALQDAADEIETARGAGG